MITIASSEFQISIMTGQSGLAYFNNCSTGSILIAYVETNKLSDFQKFEQLLINLTGNRQAFFSL